MFNRVNHPSQLVNHHFVPDSFSVVQDVHMNLDALKLLVKNLQSVRNVSTGLSVITDIQRYIDDIAAVANNLNSIVSLADNTEFLEQISPHITKAVEDIKAIKSDYDKFIEDKNNLDETLRKHETMVKNSLDTFFHKAVEMFQGVADERDDKLEELAKKVHNDLAEISEAIVASFNMKQELDTYRCYILANNAYVKVQNYLYYPSGSTRAEAYNAITLSESMGNDETINRMRMEGDR